MTFRWLMATLHLLALPLGFSSVWARGRALTVARSPADLSAAFRADNLWGLSALLWIGTGLVRIFGSLEKAPDYYMGNSPFFAKMALLGVILLLEIWPMITLIKWRMAIRRGVSVNLAPAPALARISRIQAVLVILMVFAATAMSRGLFF